MWVSIWPDVYRSSIRIEGYLMISKPWWWEVLGFIKQGSISREEFAKLWLLKRFSNQGW
jgi:hypothetical protein